MSSSAGFWVFVFAPLRNALRTNWPAFVALQACGIILAIGYFTLGTVREAGEWLLEWKKSGGLAFVAGVGVVSGAVLPEMFKAILRPTGARGMDAAGWLHLCTLMALLAVAVNFFYGLQAQWFGGLTGATALIVKIFVDQFGYALFIAIPFVLLWFEWKSHRYAIRPLLSLLQPREFFPRLMRLFVPNFLFWAPSLIALYSMPAEMQFLLYFFINAAWCLLLVLMAREIAGNDADDPKENFCPQSNESQNTD